MLTNEFSWQVRDYEKIEGALSNRILMIGADDFDSGYNSVRQYFKSLSRDESTVYFIQDAYQKRPLLPFTQCVLEELEYNNKLNLRDLGYTFIEDITCATVAKIISAFNIGKEYEVTKLLSDSENEILTVMQKRAGKKRTFFIFQYAHTFDGDSQNLITLLLSKVLDDYYPFLKSAGFIFLDHDFADPFYHDLIDYDHERIRMYEPGISDSPEIIHVFLNKEDVQLSQELFTLCGGRLSELELICAYLKKSAAMDYDLCNSSFENEMHRLFKKRLKELSAKEPLINDVLCIASEIEDTEGHFTSEELDFIFNRQQDKIEKIIEYSNREHFITPCKQYNRFAHKIIMEFFLNRSITDKPQVNRRIAEAIQRYNPEDYISLYHYYKKAGMEKEAGVKYIVYYIQVRSGRLNREWFWDEEASVLIKNCGLNSFRSQMERFFDFYDHLEYQKGLAELEEALFVEEPELLLEAQYLKSLTMRKIGKNRELLNESMEDLLFIKEEAKDTYEGLWSRCCLTLISYHVNFNGNIGGANKLFKELQAYYLKNGEMVYFRKGLYTLYRKAGAFLSPEAALKYIDKSVVYFENTPFISEYLMALNNYGAELLVLGDFQPAYEAMEKAFMEMNDALSLPVNKYYILNNFVISSILSNRLRANAFTAIFQEQLNRLEDCDTKIIPLITLGILYALDHDLDKAKETLYNAVKLSEAIEDDYYNYYIYANLSSVLYLQEDEGALPMLKQYCCKPPSLTRASLIHHYENRYQKFVKLFENPEPMMIPEFDIQFVGDEPEKPWSLIGRGFLFSDIQFWSEA